MNDFTVSLSAAQLRNKSRSIGMKLIVICGLALLMVIPSFFVADLIEDRTKREADVIKEISAHVGGQQTFLGPTLAIPYVIPSQSATTPPIRGMYLISPAKASAKVKIATQERRRSLFKVPVFQAESSFDASFDLTGVPNAAPQGAQFDWNRAELIVGVSDPRGALADATLTTSGETYTLVPAEIAQNIAFGADQNSQLKLTLLGAKVPGIAKT